MRLVFLSAISTAAGLFAVYSRKFDRHLLDGILPQLFGTDGRATIEHFLGAVGVSLSISSILVAARGWAAFGGRDWVATIPGEAPLSLGSDETQLFALLCAIAVGTVYFGTTSLWELEQAYRLVGYVGHARGAMQWEQTFADLTGSLFGMALASLGPGSSIGWVAVAAYLRKQTTSHKTAPRNAESPQS